jgi:hypothetical protein
MSSVITTPTARRGFIGKVAAAAAAIGLGSVPSRLGAETPELKSSADAALDAWFAKIKGEHRVVFDVPAALNDSDGAALES